ncbi:Eco57I restriction-modification methylase [Roseivirga ehrenbergii]|uniref:site-specific DNA-methyltransferase (adenine-specific) n=1 Tax=Roseivirga ehrenbergii (strain DSM 102268 / JCM 13514 / KCTC 12282 / NCIMB 14502 / KMM 6017) TaxID=279360 RepID=A0A150XRI0_ROSEK|nr:Eco57I restriction-modification methylase domain-containing protein [Roseivirga ehrenbergii]KYG81368.1 hypothetical protein MB14_12275 [Roseivirga ehrenbergii]TCL10510.1 Eco57I restriction-modification methylase [Roseivirga ehrenbergii]
MDKNELQLIFSSAYDESQWLRVLREVFGANRLFNSPRPISLPSNDRAEAAYELGSFTTAEGRIVGIYKVIIKPTVWLERNKVGLRELLRKVYQYDVDAALIVFEQGINWRLSFVSEIKVLNDEGEVVKQATEPKRYTYLLGEGEKTLTPSMRLSKLAGKALALKDLLDAFSVEALNQEFYHIVADKFYQLIGGSYGKGRNAHDYQALLKIPGVGKDSRRTFQEFGVRLIGRAVFCWFLKEKKSDTQQALLPENLLSSQAVKQNPGYYHGILEPLFFQTLNTKMEERIEGLPEGTAQVPFLNGGLFEPDKDDFYKVDAGTGLSTNINTLIIPDEWFLAFFEELEKYNFTIDENSVADVEVSVDPEMLGRIFENLLAEIDPDSGETARKATGSFYTPREIVDYMATESLVQYLHTKTSLEPDLLRPIFNMAEGEQKGLSETDRSEVLKALDKVKILDPACGSGAFPMGVLQKIVTGLQKLDTEATWWTQQRINENNDATARKAVKEKLKGNPEYSRKIGIIQNSLYGVDIQPIAAEISKLRCFLTLIVDENIDDQKPNRGIEPLPNLEFKFVTADTLIKLPKETDFGGLFNVNDDLDNLKRLRIDYLQSYGIEKEQIKQRFEEIRKRIEKEQLKLGKNVDTNSRAFKISTWKPFSHEKANWFDPEWMYGVKAFDIVIGNPPYVQLQKDGGALGKKYQNEGFVTFARSGDVYSLFYERGQQLLRKKGILAYITSNKWMKTDYGIKTREFFTKNTKILALVDFGMAQMFTSATTYTNILIFKSEKTEQDILPICRIPNSFKNTSNLYQFVLHNLAFVDHPNKESWIAYLPEEYKLVKQIELKGKPLTSWKNIMFRGVVTGYNDAFIIKAKELETLFNLDSKNEELIKPVLRGEDVKAYCPDFSDLYLIATFPSLNIEIDSYPAIRDFLETRKERLEPKPKGHKGAWKGRKAGSYKWFETQDSISYHREFEKSKIIFPNMTKYMPFTYDEDGYYTNQKCFIMTGEKLKYLTAVFNSRLWKFAFRKRFPELLGDTYELSKTYFEKIPIKRIEDTSVFDKLVDYIIYIKKHEADFNEALSIVDFFQNLLELLVYELYFEASMKTHGCEVAKHLTELPNISDVPEDKEKYRLIFKTHKDLTKPSHPIMTVFVSATNIPEIKLIEESL